MIRRNGLVTKLTRLFQIMHTRSIRTITPVHRGSNILPKSSARVFARELQCQEVRDAVFALVGNTQRLGNPRDHLIDVTVHAIETANEPGHTRSPARKKVSVVGKTRNHRIGQTNEDLVGFDRCNQPGPWSVAMPAANRLASELARRADFKNRPSST